MIRKHNRRAAKAAFAISFGVAIVIGLTAAAVAAAAHTRSTAKPTIVLGSKNFPEEDILGQLYSQALEAKGFAVNYKSNIGSTELMQAALSSAMDVELISSPPLVGRAPRRAPRWRNAAP